MKCDRDCFNCKFDDCIEDVATQQEIDEVNSRSQNRYRTNDKYRQYHKEYYKKYYQEHKADYKAHNKAYYEQNRERCIQSAMEYQKRKKLERSLNNEQNK